MRRLLALCAALCFLLVGCGPANSRPLLWYQDAFSEITLRDGDTVWHLTPVPGGYTAEILAPASIAGITFTVTDTAAGVHLGEVHIPVTRAMTETCENLFALLSLKEEELTRVDAPGEDPEGITCARFRRGEAEITLGLTANGLPAYFDRTIDGITERIFVSEIVCSDD